jgi:hypothetical protein
LNLNCASIIGRSFHLDKWFWRRTLKCEKWWQKLTFPLARWANQRLSRACIVHLVIKRTNWSYVKTMKCELLPSLFTF